MITYIQRRWLNISKGKRHFRKATWGMDIHPPAPEKSNCLSVLADGDILSAVL
jgi:hypothetical protein